jgi:hypothetical protein
MPALAELRPRRASSDPDVRDGAALDLRDLAASGTHVDETSQAEAVAAMVTSRDSPCPPHLGCHYGGPNRASGRTPVVDLNSTKSPFLTILGKTTRHDPPS